MHPPQEVVEGVAVAEPAEMALSTAASVVLVEMAQADNSSSSIGHDSDKTGSINRGPLDAQHA